MITYKAQKTTEIQYLADMPEPYVYMIKQRQCVTACYEKAHKNRRRCVNELTIIDWLVGQGTVIANR